MAEQLTIEQLRAKMRERVEALEDQSVSLEKAMVAYEEAIAFERQLRERLNNADMVVEIISADGKIEPFTDKRDGLTDGSQSAK